MSCEPGRTRSSDADATLGAAMAREMSDEQHEQLADRLELHDQQVMAGLIPRDSPWWFVRPEGDAALIDKGLPWWFGDTSSAEVFVIGPDEPEPPAA